MQDIKERIAHAIQSSDKSQREIAADVGVSPQAVTRWLKIGKISKENLITLAGSTDVSVNWLLGQQESLLEKYDPRPGHDSKNHPSLQLPLIGMDKLGDFVAADYHPDFTGNASVYYAINNISVSDGAFATFVEGESMLNSNPELVTFLPGWQLIVTPNMTPRPGDFVIALVGDSSEGLFRQYVKDGSHFYLKPLNTQYSMRECDDDVLICGVVVDAQMRGKFRSYP